MNKGFKFQMEAESKFLINSNIFTNEQFIKFQSTKH